MDGERGGESGGGESGKGDGREVKDGRRGWRSGRTRWVVVEEGEMRWRESPPPLRSSAVFLSGDFPRVARAHCGNDIGKYNTGLEAIHLSIKLETIGAEIVPGQIEQAETR